MTLNILEISGVAALVGGLTTILVEHFLIRKRDLKNRQWEIKRNACLDSLSALDSALSHLDWGGTPNPPTKQAISISKIRRCQSELIVSCHNSKIAEKFMEIAVPNGEIKATVLLNEFRNMIRHELGFGPELIFDEDRAWIGKIQGDTPE